LLPIAFAVLAFTFAFSHAGRMTFRFTLQSIALLPVIYFFTHFPRSWFARPLNHPVLVHLGTLSYALYLIHGAIIQMVLKFVHAPTVILWIVAAVAVYLSGVVIHLGIEQPFLRVRARHAATQGSQDRPAVLQVSRSS
jgi:peptidoglycan/LPS O-acetylase OafA/YrhL